MRQKLRQRERKPQQKSTLIGFASDRVSSCERKPSESVSYRKALIRMLMRRMMVSNYLRLVHQD